VNFKISIITVTKNSERFLSKTIESVIDQTYANIEYIIIDGNSTDSTKDIIKKYENKIDKFVSEQDNGMYEAINKGLSLSTGDYILVLNSDDMLADSKVIENVVSVIQKSQLDWYYGNIIKLKGSKQVYTRLFNVNYNDLLMSTHGTFVPHPCFFISAALNKKLNGYHTTYKFASDYDYILRALMMAPAKGQHINLFITKFRIHTNSITASGSINKERIQILANHQFYKIPVLRRFYYFYKLWIYYKILNMVQ